MAAVKPNGWGTALGLYWLARVLFMQRIVVMPRDSSSRRASVASESSVVSG